jgi:hypothetical protein
MQKSSCNSTEEAFSLNSGVVSGFSVNAVEEPSSVVASENDNAGTPVVFEELTLSFRAVLRAASEIPRTS